MMCLRLGLYSKLHASLDFIKKDPVSKQKQTDVMVYDSTMHWDGSLYPALPTRVLKVNHVSKKPQKKKVLKEAP